MTGAAGAPAWLLGAAALVWALHADAHKLAFSTTDLSWRVDRGTLEVVHAVHLDDAMVLLARLGDPRGEMDPATQARLLLYAERHFGLSREGEPLVLEPVGAQIDGDYLWVYQEYTADQPPDRLSVRCTLLHELFAEQQNQINLRVGDAVRSVRLSRTLPTGELLLTGGE